MTDARQLDSHGLRTGVLRGGLAIPLLLTLLVAVSARQAYIGARPAEHLDGLGCYADTYAYLDLARNLASIGQYSMTTFRGEIEPSSYKPPLYSILLAAQISLGIEEYHTFRAVQGLLDSSSAVFVFLAAWFLFRRRSTALAAGLLMALSPFNIHYSRALLSDWLGSTLMALSLMCLVAALARRRCDWLAASAAAMGLAVLTRPASLAFPLVVAPFVFFAFRGDRWQARWGAVGLFLLVFTVVVGSWTLRNYRVTGHFIAVSAGGKASGLLRGTWETPQNWSWRGLPVEEIPDEKERERIGKLLTSYKKTVMHGSTDSVIAINEEMEQLARERIRRNPRRHLELSISRVPMLWWNHSKRIYLDPDPPGLWVHPFLIGWLLSLLFARGRVATLLPVWLFPVYITLLHMPVHVEPRYSLIAFPALCIAAGPLYGALFRRAFSRLTNRRTGSPRSSSRGRPERSNEPGTTRRSPPSGSSIS
jgi:4-amino-4-deoxy-L-arabinose transferase-like glycosyltransferase